MDSFYEILSSNPEVGLLLIGSSFGAIGFLLKSVIDSFIESKKYKKDIRKEFWREKVNAAKKASEYYYDHLELIGLMIHNIDVTVNSSFSGSLQNSIQETMAIYSNRSVNPSSFEHHHIRVFYDIDSSKFDKLNRESFEIIQELESIEINDSDADHVVKKKLDDAKETLLKLKKNHEESKLFYNENLKKIKEDLASYVK